MMTSTSTPAAPQTRRALRAMGTDVLFALDAPPSALTTDAFDRAEHELHRLVRVFDRFDDSSELRRLERHRAQHCSQELREVLLLALDARRRSGGRFDPTILPSLRALGYDRSIEHVRGLSRGSNVLEHHPGGVVLDEHTGIVALGTGVALDLGGIAKGWIADRIATMLATTAPALVDAGGDVSCTPRRDGVPWVVEITGIEHDRYLQLEAGGIATSGIDRRRWRSADGSRADRHHVVDPSTGASAATDLVRVTVIAGSCALAETAATSMLVGGSQALEELGDVFDVAWLAVPIDPDVSPLRSKEL